MCLHPEEIPPIPNETVRVAKAAFPKGNLYMRLRDELGMFYQDEDFASLYPQRGQPAQAPWRLAMILVMQYLENLSDRQAVQAVQGRIDWKYALSLELTDPGFDFTVLSEFRDRLIAGGVEQQILDLMLSKFQERKLLSARGKQRTDSTHVLTVVRNLTRLEHLGETLRYALNAVAEVEATWLKSLAPAEWYDRYSKRFEDTRLPRTASEREVLAQTIGADGFYLLDNIYSQTSPIQLRQLLAVEVLRQVWLQQYYAPTDKIQLRDEKDGPPGAVRIRSPYDLKIDWQQKAVYCPQGKRSYLWKKNKSVYGKPVIYVEFRQRDCKNCPVRNQCTRAKTNPRGLTIQAQSDYEALQKARVRQKTEQFQKQYALRSGIEGTISQGIRAFELRDCRYIGLAKTYLQHILTAAAINLSRVFAWLEDIPLAKTRSSHFARLADATVC